MALPHPGVFQSFDSLQFLNPFSAKADRNRYTGKIVFLKDVTDKPGVLVVRYTDKIGILRHRFKSIHSCLNSGARRTYNNLVESKATQIQFSIIPVEPKKHPKILKKLQEEHERQRVDHYFELVRPWLLGEKTEKFPISRLEYRRPFISFDGFRRSSFLEYAKRPGLYIIREHLIQENRIVDAYVGESRCVLLSRVRDKFYPNQHLYYEEIPGIKEYHICMIEIPKHELPRERTAQKKKLVEYQNQLIAILDPRDNLLGKVKIDADLFTDGKGYAPVWKGKGTPF